MATQKEQQPPSYSKDLALSDEQGWTHTVWINVRPGSTARTITIDDFTTFQAYQLKLRALNFPTTKSEGDNDRAAAAARPFNWTSWLYVRDEFDAIFIGEHNWPAVRSQILEGLRKPVMASGESTCRCNKMRYPRLEVHFEWNSSWLVPEPKTPEQVERMQRRREANENEMLVQGRYVPEPELRVSSGGCIIM